MKNILPYTFFENSNDDFENIKIALYDVENTYIEWQNKPPEEITRKEIEQLLQELYELANTVLYARNNISMYDNEDNDYNYQCEINRW